MKLSVDEQEALMSIMDHPGWRVLWKVIDNEIASIGDDIIRLDLTVNNEKDLIKLKLVHQGAKSLAVRLKQRLEPAAKRQSLTTKLNS